MTKVGDYSQNFALNTIAVGRTISFAVGKTKGTLYVVRGAKPTAAKPRPIGADDLSSPDYLTDRNLIKTRHIKVHFMKDPVYVDVAFIDSSVKDEDIRMAARLLGYKEVQIVFASEVELLD